MKKLSYSLATFIVILILATYFNIPDLAAQTKIDLSGANIRAVEGDTVWVLLNHIKHDKRQQFEKFIQEIFWPKADELAPAVRQVFLNTRVLHPVNMNKDSTYTYVFLMDPVITKGNYNISYLLKKMYSEDKAKEYYAMWKDCYSSPQVGYVLIQSQY
ncbi:MAG: hypothetical protein GXO74_16105 [Calditrichaeota bacterium]|nr:hypothetical protein [Calditrichota bacterium]